MSLAAPPRSLRDIHLDFTPAEWGKPVSLTARVPFVRCSQRSQIRLIPGARTT